MLLPTLLRDTLEHLTKTEEEEEKTKLLRLQKGSSMFFLLLSEHYVLTPFSPLFEPFMKARKRKPKVCSFNFFPSEVLKLAAAGSPRPGLEWGKERNPRN